MDGAVLVYEPTLESVLHKNPLKAKSELERPGRARLIIPLSTSQPKTSTAPPNVFAARRRSALQIAAGIVLAVVAFVAFYAAPRLFRGRAQTSTNTLETQNPKLETSHLSPAVSDTSVMSEQPGTRNARLETYSATEDKPETPNSKLETSPLSDKLETRNPKRKSAVPALPGLKPLPRLKPLPTLKPLPRLADQSRSLNANRRAVVVNAKENANANAKKESRFGSFLKKTGRILTKPFKS